MGVKIGGVIPPGYGFSYGPADVKQSVDGFLDVLDTILDDTVGGCIAESGDLVLTMVSGLDSLEYIGVIRK